MFLDFFIFIFFRAASFLRVPTLSPFGRFDPRLFLPSPVSHFFSPQVWRGEERGVRLVQDRGGVLFFSGLAVIFRP